MDAVVDGLAQCGYAVARDALPAPVIAGLRERLQQVELAPARIGRGDTRQARADIRGDRIAWLGESPQTHAEASLLSWLDALRAACNRELMLGLVDFEGHYAAYPPGSGYARHRDRFRDDDARAVSCVLYLNDAWRAADGGALRLHLAQGETLDVLPEAGTFVAFLSAAATNSSETELMERFARLNIGAGKTFDFSKLSPEAQKAVTDGIADAGQDLAGLLKKINADEVSSSDMFGSRTFLKNNYLYRYAGAKLGLYGNSGEEAIYLAYFVDSNHQPLDSSKASYTMQFPKGQLPPAKAFWSVTMYDGKTQLLVANPLKRYLLNSTMLKSFKYGPDGSLTLYVQKDSPGAEKQSNWLPAPDGPFYAILRIYMPAPEVINGTWKKPLMVPTQ